MKQQPLVAFFILGLVALVLFTVYCGKSAKMTDMEIIAHLETYLNSSNPGSQLKIDPANAVVEPIEKNRYRITLKNTPFITDLTGVVDVILKAFTTSDEGHPERNVPQIEEIALIYGPEEKYLNLLYWKNLSLEGGYSRSQSNNYSSAFGGVVFNRFRVSIGKVTFQDEEADDTGSSQTMEHLKIHLSGQAAQKDAISFLLDFEKISAVDTGKEDNIISAYLLDINAKPPNLRKVLETGSAINDLTIQLGKINLSITKNDASLCEGAVEQATYLQFMKPDKDRQAFKIGNGLRFKNFKLFIPGNPAIELLSDVKEFQFDYSINNLSPEAALVFLDIVKSSFTSRNPAAGADNSEVMSLVTKFLFEVMKSKTDIRFSISPFKHYFGEMGAEVNIRLYNLMAGSVLTAEATLFKADDMLKKLREARIFSDASMQAIAEFIEKNGKKTENGDVSFLYEMDVNQLRALLFKANPRVPPMTF